MAKQNRLGKDPLAWIQSTQIPDNPIESKPDLQSNLSLQSNPELQSTQNYPGDGVSESAKVKKTTHAGLQDGWTRATFIVKEDHLETLKSLAYYQRRNIKEVLEEAMVTYFQANQAEISEANLLYSKSGKKSR